MHGPVFHWDSLLRHLRFDKRIQSMNAFPDVFAIRRVNAIVPLTLREPSPMMGSMKGGGDGMGDILPPRQNVWVPEMMVVLTVGREGGGDVESDGGGYFE